MSTTSVYMKLSLIVIFSLLLFVFLVYFLLKIFLKHCSRTKKELRGHTRIMSGLLKQCLCSPDLRDCRACRSCSETGARALRSGCCLPLTETKSFPPSWWFLLGNLTPLTKLLRKKKKKSLFFSPLFLFIYLFFTIINNIFRNFC